MYLKSTLTLAATLLATQLSLSAATIAFQSFEGQPSDTWSYTLDPNVTFDGGGDTWAETTSMTGFDYNTAPDGSQFWGGRDMDGQAGFTPTTRGWVILGDIDVSAYTDKSLSLYWSGEGNIDEIGYLVVTTANGSNAVITPDMNLNNSVPGGVTLASSNIDQDWTEVIVPLADNVTNVSVGLYGLSTGSGRYLAFDNVELSGVIPEPGTFALILGGIAVVIACVRRRTKR